MATLSSILQAKISSNSAFDRVISAQSLLPNGETNLTDYQAFSYSAVGSTGTTVSEVNWAAPAAGTAIIEIWGASGSGGRMCCCGSGVPGNPGAYVRKTISVNIGDTITGTPGHSSNNADTLCYRGRSESTGVCFVSTTDDADGCLCAEGGFGGQSICAVSSTSMFCCFEGAGFSTTVGAGGVGCGIVCNIGGTASAVEAQGFGGEINCTGGVSKTSMQHCNPSCYINFLQTMAVSPGIFSAKTSYVTPTGDCLYSNSGAPEHAYVTSLASLARTPGSVPKWSSPAQGGIYCACHDSVSCQYFLPTGAPGTSGQPAASQRNSGLRGGPGTIKIKFLES